MPNSRQGGKPSSPTTQLLNSIGMTRDDLRRHSEQMRQFLTVDEGRTFAPQTIKQRSKPRAPFLNEKSRSSSSANASVPAYLPTSPRTPVKSEPVEKTTLSRPLDTMEMILEHKVKDKKDRKHSNTQPRDDRRVQQPLSFISSRSSTPQALPETPHHYKYYSERVVSEALTPQRPFPSLITGIHAIPITPRQNTYTQLKGSALHLAGSDTPSGRHIYSVSRTPLLTSSPCSSPVRVVNLVSSPGPMRSSPLPEDEDEELPYILPPGPYSDVKPDFAYAGLIGQAILSSPQHRLTLQDIYEWITTVYPYYKRGEQTWMNSIRHCLSTMAVFRKVPRGRTEGKSLWAIFDCDVECFVGGGFKKSLCTDMVKANQEKASKRSARKRGAMAMEELTHRTIKRQRKSDREGGSAGCVAGPIPAIAPAPILPPLFASFQTNPQHQPYYQPYLPPPMPADVIFPPLPPSSNFHRMATIQTPSASVRKAEHDHSHQILVGDLDLRGCNSSSSSSVPSLTPSCSSSSSPPLFSLSSLVEGDADSHRVHTPSSMDEALAFLNDDSDGEDSEWLRGAPVVDAIQGVITLLGCEDSLIKETKKDKEKSIRKQNQTLSSRPVQVSPTLERRAAKQRGSLINEPITTPPRPVQLPTEPCTPPRRLITPPRTQRVTSSGLHLSPIRTPISHAGLHMSPSPSLSHYKSNLDPPPTAAYFPQAPLLSAHGEEPKTPPPVTRLDDVHTPSRKRSARKVSGPGSLFNLSPFAPVTPNRGTHQGGSNDSPFRTPSQFFYDPHDPTTILSEELASRAFDTSPGLFGSKRPRHSLLYESPTGSSPSSWDRLW
ncbi:uncharacterized protein FIBRA_08530 [Fibroporia radiculosa]|uniref:Fork-head domain-containing protein n=1 Tax=Fibroporia radiculosa TaxID=599839 RepID=J4H581_9APHY|nr:uncharacterized protein FIBRA_08530 [Fibroporia radiculosa]CCM06279.1 predicted protein [Fibroporia radiculosa]